MVNNWKEEEKVEEEEEVKVSAAALIKRDKNKRSEKFNITPRLGLGQPKKVAGGPDNYGAFLHPKRPDKLVNYPADVQANARRQAEQDPSINFKAGAEAADINFMIDADTLHLKSQRDAFFSKLKRAKNLIA